MSKGPSTTPTSGASPLWLDFVVLLLGCAVALLLAQWSGLQAQTATTTPGWLSQHIASLLPLLVWLPAGAMLGWPIFYITSRFRGLTSELTLCELLWSMLWLLDVAVVGLYAWRAFGTLPEILDPAKYKELVAWAAPYAVYTLAGIAVLAVCYDLAARQQRPWTHALCIALLLWPLLPWALTRWGHVTLGFAS